MAVIYLLAWIASSQTAAPRNDLLVGVNVAVRNETPLAVIASLRSNPAQRLRCDE